MPPEVKRIGPWTLSSELGRGGNAVVWAAKDEHGTEAALKVINAKRVDKEPYRRFVQEIEFLQSIGDFAGIMPFISARLPESPTADDRPWLAMPVATPIREALAGAPLETVVDAMAALADALARLEVGHGAAHRDIKPGNLYSHHGKWVLGDFGLVAVPDRDGLTRADKPLGPAHYVPYEMLVDPVGADPHKADVFSLGKTLWVLACEQAFPPQGHQRADQRGFSISDFRPHAHASVLDQFVDRMTRPRPEDRPTKTEVAAELAAWTSLRSTPIQIDLTEVRRQLRERMATELNAQDLADERRDLAHAAIRRLNALCAPLNAAFRDLHPRAQIDAMGDEFTQNMLKTHRHSGSPDIVLFWHRHCLVQSGPDYMLYELRMGRGIELTADGALIFRAYLDVGHRRISGTDFHWRSPERHAPVGTAEAEQILIEGVEELAEQLPDAARAFLEHFKAND